MTVAKKGFSPEAKGYRATLKALGATESTIHREGAVKMRAERMKAEESESVEVKAGKERLEELVERGDVDQNTMERLAIYLDCEPWEALKKLEGRGSILNKFIEAHRNRFVELKDDRSNFNLLDSYVGGDLRLVLRDADGLDLLDWYGDPTLRANNATDPEYGKITLDNEMSRLSYVSNGVTPDGKNIFLDIENLNVIDIWSLSKDHIKDKVWFSTSWDEKNLKILPALLRRDWWTMGREIAMALPGEFGYKDAREADLMITAQVEKIGRAFSQDFKKIDGAFYVGPKTEKQEKLRELDKKVAQEIVAGYRQVLENRRLVELAAKNEVRKADRAYKAERHGLLARLHEIEKQLGVGANLPAVREAAGPVAWFNKKMEGLAQMVSAKVRQQKQLVDSKREALWVERRQVASELTAQNNQAVRDQRKLALDDAPRSSSKDNGKYRENGVDVNYWSKKADDEMVNIVDEDLLQGQLDELKNK
jgi:hypothetical protein